MPPPTESITTPTTTTPTSITTPTSMTAQPIVQQIKTEPAVTKQPPELIIIGHKEADCKNKDRIRPSKRNLSKRNGMRSEYSLDTIS